MPRAFYERLSPESTALLEAERADAFAHSALLLVLEPGPLAHAEQGVDFDAIRAGIEAGLAAVPRARQKLRWIPFERHPVWVDDPDFSLEYHLRHTSLPRPGSEAQLRRMVARIHAQRLDRRRPLWECWALEGLEGGRFALLWKSHLCTVDPASGPDLLEGLLSARPDAAPPPASGWRPRPVPSAFELVRDEVVRQARLPRRAVERAARALRAPDLRHELEERARGLAKLLGYSIRPRTQTPLSGPCGPHRRFARLVLPLDAARDARRALGVPLHDLLLAALAGAVRRFFAHRLVNPATVDFRVSTPVALEAGGPDEAIAEWRIELPIWEKDPRERLERIRRQTRDLSEGAPALGARAQAGPAWTGSRRLALGVRAVSPRLPTDLAFVDVPGPQQPLYFLGARLVEAFGLVPLRPDHALSVSVLGYDGRLCWALNADFDRLPDLDRFAAALEASFDELVRAAGGAPRLEVVRGGSAADSSR